MLGRPLLQPANRDTEDAIDRALTSVRWWSWDAIPAPAGYRRCCWRASPSAAAILRVGSARCRHAPCTRAECLCVYLEGRQQVGRERFGFGQVDSSRIAVAAVDQEFVVQVRAGGQARGPDQADALTLAHAIAPACQFFRQVQVAGDDVVAVFEEDVVAVGPGVAGLEDGAVAGGPDRRAGGRGVIGAVVRPNPPGDRMEAPGSEDRPARSPPSTCTCTSTRAASWT